jgi:hypothetical protein
MIRQAAVVRKTAWYAPVTRPLVLLLLGTLTWVRCLSQALPEQKKAVRHKLGSVLEGGGALGLAHIGVITWMEEHRIPVSCVAGTSMGRLVGGIYGTGRSTAEAENSSTVSTVIRS